MCIHDDNFKCIYNLPILESAFIMVSHNHNLDFEGGVCVSLVTDCVWLIVYAVAFVAQPFIKKLHIISA